MGGSVATGGGPSGGSGGDAYGGPGGSGSGGSGAVGGSGGSGAVGGSGGSGAVGGSGGSSAGAAGGSGGASGGSGGAAAGGGGKGGGGGSAGVPIGTQQTIATCGECPAGYFQKNQFYNDACNPGASCGASVQRYCVPNGMTTWEGCSATCLAGYHLDAIYSHCPCGSAGDINVCVPD